MAALADSGTTLPQQLQILQEAAGTRGVELSIHAVRNPDEIAVAIDTAKNSGAEALNVLVAPLFFNDRKLILERVAALRLPAIYQWTEIGEQGGLLCYGPSIVQVYRDILARQFIKLLRAAKPAELPIEQPTRFALVINLRDRAGNRA
jgi:putative ABC transport system substrate-binding protein